VLLSPQTTLTHTHKYTDDNHLFIIKIMIIIINIMILLLFSQTILTHKVSVEIYN